MASGIPPCALLLPIVAIPFLALVFPLWVLAWVVLGGAWLLLAPVDWLARRRGRVSPLRARVGRGLAWLRRPTLRGPPEAE